MDYYYFASLYILLQLKEIISLEDNFQKSFSPQAIDHQITQKRKYKFFYI